MIDCKGLHILPGVMDTQVHFREPGLTHKEDLETGSRSAVMGGVTAVFEMPNTDPLTVTEAAFTDKIKRGRHRMHCDFAFFIGGTRENVQDLPELERAPGCAGVKVFIGSSTGALLVEDDESLRRIFQVIRRRAAFHAEDEYRLNERKPLRVEGDPRSHPVWRDETAALMATERLVNLARETGKRIHVLHISTKQEIEYLRDHKDVASCEATPHHLTHGRARMLRAARHPRADEPAGALGRSSRGHLARHRAGHRRRARLRPCAAYAGREGEDLSGVTLGHDGVQTLVPSCWTTSMRGGCRWRALSISPAPAPRACSTSRARAGSRPAMTPISRWSISSAARPSPNKWVASKAGWTPYDGMRVTGWPVGTFVRGKRVMWQGELVTRSLGRAGAVPGDAEAERMIRKSGHRFSENIMRR